MKKFFLLLVFPALLSVTAKAQDSSEFRKPEAGDVTTEVNLGLFNTGVTLSNVFNQLKGRYFFHPTTALRLGFNANINSGEVDNDFQNTTNIHRSLKSSNFIFAPGVEKHFSGTDRLSPYIGAELAFAFYRFHEEQTRLNSTTKNVEYINSWSHGHRSNNQIKLNAVAGVDYYFASHFYAGLEVGYGLGIKKEKQAEIITDGVSAKTDGNTSLGLGAYTNNGIRIGFVF